MCGESRTGVLNSRRALRNTFCMYTDTAHRRPRFNRICRSYASDNIATTTTTTTMTTTTLVSMASVPRKHLGKPAPERQTIVDFAAARDDGCVPTKFSLQCFDTVGSVTGRASGLKNWMLVCWRWHFECSFARLTARVVTTTSIVLSSSKVQNGDILVLANQGPPGKWPLKWRERKEMMEVAVVTTGTLGHANHLHL